MRTFNDSNNKRRRICTLLALKDAKEENIFIFLINNLRYISEKIQPKRKPLRLYQHFLTMNGSESETLVCSLASNAPEYVTVFPASLHQAGIS